MHADEEIDDYVNNRDPNAMHMGLEAFTQHRRHGPDSVTTDANATTGPQFHAVRPRLARQRHRSYGGERIRRFGRWIWRREVPGERQVFTSQWSGSWIHATYARRLLLPIVCS